MNARLLTGDALTVLRTLPDASVRCCVTSPPYWGLRDYGTASWEGGDPACDHAQTAPGRATRPAGGLEGGKATVDAGTVRRGDCGRCGATRIDQQLGLEPTPEEYVAAMVDVFREVRRVLTDDGTLWLNLGDSYKNFRVSQCGQGLHDGEQRDKPTGRRAVSHFLKEKDLVGIPWRVAFALQADGWYLRSDIIWAKPNPMPESVTDRPTKAHEYLFLLAKSPKYYYDAAAIAEPLAAVSAERYAYSFGGAKTEALIEANVNGIGQRTRVLGAREMPVDRNARTVWTIPTQPYAAAHFATFPEELARRCIVAGSATGDTVLDPFSGSGTVAQVATGNGRHAIGIELNPEYQHLARQRIGPLLCTEATE